MRGQLYALQAELLKLKHARILWVTMLAFALAPIMGGVFIIIMRSPEALEKAGSLSAKAQLMNFSADWNSYLDLLTQAIGVGGILVFGFVASWIFGREYSDATAKNLLALPTSRIKILNAKFIVYLLWCLVLAISNLLIGGLIGVLLSIPVTVPFDLNHQLGIYSLTTLMTLLLGTPLAFFAIWGKGYLAPLGVVVLMLVFAQIIGAVGYGYYFPWSVPGLFSGIAGTFKEQLDVWSYVFLFTTGIVGYASTVLYWKYADQSS